MKLPLMAWFLIVPLTQSSDTTEWMLSMRRAARALRIKEFLEEAEKLRAAAECTARPEGLPQIERSPLFQEPPRAQAGSRTL